MRSLILVAALSLVGCSIPTLNSDSKPSQSTTTMTKCCGCPGMDHCSTGQNGAPCCTPDDCKCKEVTVR